MAGMNRRETFRYGDIAVDVPVAVDQVEYEEDGRPILAFTDDGKVTHESDQALACFEALEWLSAYRDAEWYVIIRACSGTGAWRHEHRAGFIAMGMAWVSPEDRSWETYYMPFYIDSVDGVVHYRLWYADDLMSLTRDD